MRASSALAPAAGSTRPAAPSTPMMASSSATGTCLKRGGRPSSANSMLALLARRDRRPGPPMGSTRLQRWGRPGSRPGSRQVVVADGLAGRQPPVAEDQEGLALLHPRDLARQRLEEGRRPHDRVGAGPRPASISSFSKASLACWKASSGFCTQIADSSTTCARRPAAPPRASTCAWWSMAQASAARRCARPGRTPARRSARRASRRAQRGRVGSPTRTVAPGSSAAQRRPA
jgi:hypothetical protein